MNEFIETLEFPALFQSAAPVATGVRFAEAAAFSLLAGLSAQLAIHLPFTPVPITGQTFVILCAGALLGSRWGTFSVVLYLIEGCAGLPFFAAGGAVGAARLLGPTGGYLIGFVAAAWVVGKLTEHGWGRSPASAAAMIALGSGIVFAFGLVGLSRFVPIGRLLALGFYPFLLGDLLKICFAAAVLPLGRRLVQR